MQQISYATISEYIKPNRPAIVYVPNAFTPLDNGHLNNIFKPVFSGEIEKGTYKITVYNRWGETLFESKNIDLGWDGKYDGKSLSVDTYIWHLEYQDKNSAEITTLNGTVSIIK